jgi:hypothetical protein
MCLIAFIIQEQILNLPLLQCWWPYFNLGVMILVLKKKKATLCHLDCIHSLLQADRHKCVLFNNTVKIRDYIC